MNPDIIILDEVMPELDEKNKSLIADTINILQKSGKTVILIDHDIENLMMADYIYLMKDGKIEAIVEGDMDDELLYNKLSDFFLSQI